MKYMMLIYGSEAERAKMPQEQLQAEMGAYFAFGAEADKSGIQHTGEALHDVAKATTVRVREGKTLTSDGPFADTKEQLGGFYLMDCKDLDEAITWASKIPGARHGSIEIRPVIVFE